MDKITHEVRLNNWKSIVEECNDRQQGVTVKQWLRDRGINEKVYYYWLRRVRQAAYDQMKAENASNLAIPSNNNVSYAEITLTTGEPAQSINSAAAVLSTGNISIAISEAASEDFLIKLMRAMRYAG